MTRPVPTLRQLSHLVALHDEGQFTRAASATSVSQSALSVAVAELERLMGVSLIDRSRRTIRFTAAGEATVARARSLLRDAGDLVTEARLAAEPLTGPLRLAVIPTVAPFLLPRLLPAIATAWPRLDLFVREMLTTPACEAMHADRVDCVLLALPVVCGAVTACELLTDRLVLVEAGGGAAAEEPITASELNARRLLFLDDGHCLTEHALAACRRSDEPGDQRLIASTLPTLVRLVEAGEGSTLVPQMAIDAGLLSGVDVVCRQVVGVAAQRRVALAWRQGHPRANEFQQFGETLRPARPASLPGGGDTRQRAVDR